MMIKQGRAENHELTGQSANNLTLLMIRAVICLFFCGAAIAVFFSESNEEAWIFLHNFIVARIFAVFAFVAGVFILCGLLTYQAAIAAGLLILTLVVDHLIENPFYNFSAQLFPLMLFMVALLYFNLDYNVISLDRMAGIKPAEQVKAGSWAVLLLRIFLGSIFVTQGLNSIIKVGIINFAQKLYVAPFAESWMPQFLLWVAGVLNPPVQLLGGIALIIGFKTRAASQGIGIFLVSIIFGHMIQGPFEDIHDFSIANFIAALLIIFLESGGNRYSLDYILEKHGAGKNYSVT